MKVWVTRDDDGEDRCCVSCGKPDQQDSGHGTYYIVDAGPFFEGQHGLFRKGFGFTPRKGSCKQYELKLEAV
jgi:hypothetical protein